MQEGDSNNVIRKDAHDDKKYRSSHEESTGVPSQKFNNSNFANGKRHLMQQIIS